MQCEKCKTESDSTYGSGRFCSSKCAKSFATSKNREVINSKTSQTLKNRNDDKDTWSKLDQKTKDIIKSKISVASKLRAHKLRYETPYEELANRSREIRFDRLFHEQAGLCDICKIPAEWNGLPLKFQLDHVDGNRKNNSRENNRLLCPNCHSQTPTWGNKQGGQGKSGQGGRDRTDDLGAPKAVDYHFPTP